jgi:hypothetical protein
MNGLDHLSLEQGLTERAGIHSEENHGPSAILERVPPFEHPTFLCSPA